MNPSTDPSSTQARSGAIGAPGTPLSEPPRCSGHFPANRRAPSLVDRGLQALLRRCFGEAPLRFALFDGTELSVTHTPSVATVLLRDRVTLLRILMNPEARFGEAYSAGEIRVRGDLVAAIEAAYVGLNHRRRAAHAEPPRAHSLGASRRNARWHYDLGNDFYRLWLDRELLYSCAYFPTPECSLEQAQVAKMDRVCRKLDLRPGERIVEAGCGWGALALHMARHYGVFVRAYNVSHEQICYARERAWNEGLAGRVEFVEDDYRQIAGGFDAFVSVGMLEHVGVASYGVLGEVIRRCLHGGRGRGLLHFIGRDRPEPFNAWIRGHIFPGAYPPALSQVIEHLLEPADLSVLDVENLRAHYAMTLAHWRARYEAAAEAVRQRHGDELTRAFRLYLAGSEAAFRVGSLQFFQVLIAPGGQRGVRWARELGRQPWTAVTS